MMTNFEWLQERINEMTLEELGRAWERDEAPWCDCNCRDTEDACVRCVERWASQPYKAPMPELKTGLFVEYYDKAYEKPSVIFQARGFGVIVGDKIVCQDGSYFEGLKDEYTLSCIVKIFEADYFNNCNKDTCIWERTNDES